MTTRVSLAELAAADIQLRPAEAVAVVAEICRQYSSGVIRGIPSPGVIRLTREGDIVAEGPVTAGSEPGVRRAAHLLTDLLPEFDAPAEYRASGGLRLVVARALGTLDLPPYATLDAFCEALVRFSVADLRTTVRGLFHAWEQAVAARRAPVPPPALTISDIRRARRATGLSLDDLSAVADVPAARLRELEWGYLRNWRSDDEGRAQVLRYARAAGLDEAVVLSIAWPMIEEAGALGQEQSEPAAALAPRAPGTMALAAPIASQPSGSRLMSWGVVSVAAALLALATFGAIIARQEPKANRVAASSEPALTPEARPAEIPPPGGPAVTPAAQHVEALVAAGPAVTADAPSVEPAAAAAPAPAAPRRQVAPRPRARPAAAPHRRPAPRHQSFFRKELFRIVIR